MTLRSRVKKVFVLFIMLCLVYSSLSLPISTITAKPIDSTASTTVLFSDLEDHWAGEPLKKWAAAGLIKGYPNGTFQPDRTVNRGEAFALINRSFGLNEQIPIDFSDLAASDWEYEDVAKAMMAGYVKGFADGTVGVKKSLSRQEAAVIISRLLGLDTNGDSAAVDVFTDEKHISQWSRAAVAAMAAAQLMKGYDDGSFKPEAFITRAELVVLLDRALNVTTPMEYNVSGTYGPVDSVRTINGNVIVNATGVTLQNMKITGDLLLVEGIGEGDVFLNNVTVLGTTTVKGGGINSIHIDNSELTTVIVDRAAGTVRIVIKGTTTITEVIVKSSVILEVRKEAKII